jgi:hypothetical protein
MRASNQGEFAVGRALRPAGHRAASSEPDEGLRYAEGPSVIVAPFVEGGEPLVGLAADEALGHAGLVEPDRLLGVALAASSWCSIATSKPHSRSSSVPIPSLSDASRPKSGEGSPEGGTSCAIGPRAAHPLSLTNIKFVFAFVKRFW